MYTIYILLINSKYCNHIFKTTKKTIEKTTNVVSGVKLVNTTMYRYRLKVRRQSNILHTLYT